MSKENTSHAIMFHHFHGGKHRETQGSISLQQFSAMLDWLGDKYSLLSADEYFDKFCKDQLDKKDICLTFDDALLCQFDIAVPELNRRNLRAFFFVYSSPFEGNLNYLEIYRYFRTICFNSVDEFYEDFFSESRVALGSDYDRHFLQFSGANYLSAFPFYSQNDRWFRYLRDVVLKVDRYNQLMNKLMAKHSFDPAKMRGLLWMSNEHLYELDKQGHIVGLHSYSHPTSIHQLSKEEQLTEYSKNLSHLKGVLKKVPAAMSHPCGNYSDTTLEVLSNMGVQIGFRSNMAVRTIRSKFEIPREDHANILVEMNS